MYLGYNYTFHSLNQKYYLEQESYQAFANKDYINFLKLIIRHNVRKRGLDKYAECFYCLV